MKENFTIDIINQKGIRRAKRQRRTTRKGIESVNQAEIFPSNTLPSNDFSIENSHSNIIENGTNKYSTDSDPGCLSRTSLYSNMINIDVQSNEHRHALELLRDSQYGYMMFNNYENSRWNHKRVRTKWNSKEKRKERKLNRSKKEIQKHIDETISTLLSATKYIKSQHIHWKECGQISQLLLHNNVLASNVKYYSKLRYFQLSLQKLEMLNISTTIDVELFYQIPKFHIQPLLFSCNEFDGNNMQQIYFELMNMNSVAVSFCSKGLFMLVPPVEKLLKHWNLKKYDLFASGTTYVTVYEKLAQSNIPLLGAFICLNQENMIDLQSTFLKNDKVMNDIDMFQYLTNMLGTYHPNVSRDKIDKILNIINEANEDTSDSVSMEDDPIKNPIRTTPKKVQQSNVNLTIPNSSTVHHELHTPLKTQINISSPKSESPPQISQTTTFKPPSQRPPIKTKNKDVVRTQQHQIERSGINVDQQFVSKSESQHGQIIAKSERKKTLKSLDRPSSFSIDRVSNDQERNFRGTDFKNNRVKNIPNNSRHVHHRHSSPPNNPRSHQPPRSHRSHPIPRSPHSLTHHRSHSSPHHHQNRSNSSPHMQYHHPKGIQKENHSTMGATRFLWVSYKKNAKDINNDVLKQDFRRFGPLDKIRTNPSHFAFIDFLNIHDAIKAVNYWKSSSKYDKLRFNSNNDPRPRQKHKNSRHFNPSTNQHRHYNK